MVFYGYGANCECITITLNTFMCLNVACDIYYTLLRVAMRRGLLFHVTMYASFLTCQSCSCIHLFVIHETCSPATNWFSFCLLSD